MSGQSFRVKKYSFEDGLPDNYIFDLIQDTNGVMWFTSRAGIFSYDAVEWTTLNIENKSEPPGKYLELDDLGNIWVAPENTNGQIYFYDYNSWQKFPIPQFEELLQCNSFSIINEGFNRILLIGTNEGLLVHQNGEWKLLTTEDALPNNYIFSTSRYNENNFIVATMEGLSTFSPEVGVTPLTKYDLPGKAVFATFNEQLEDERFVWLLGNNWTGYLHDGEFHGLNRKFDFPVFNTPHEYFITSDNQNRIYVGNQVGAFWIDRNNGELHILSDDQGTIKEGATNAFVDREKNVWFSSKRGILKIRKSVFVNYYKSTGLLENEVSAIEGFGNNLVLGHNNGLSLLNDNSVRSIEFADSNPGISNINRVLDFQLFNNRLYFAASTKGVGYLDKNLNLIKINNIIGNSVNSLAVDKDGVLWGGTNRGLIYLKGDKFVFDNHFKNHFSSLQFIRKLVSMEDGRLGIFTINSGVIFKDGKKLKKYLSSDYLANSTYDAITVNDTIVVATSAGLYYVGEDSLYRYSGFGNITNFAVYFIQKGKDNNIWFGLSKGVYLYNGKTLQHFGEEDGLSGPETNRSASFIDSEGDFWVGTNKGLSNFVTEYARELNIKPKIQITRIENNSGQSFSPHDAISLESSENTVWIHYRGLSFIDESENSFSLSLFNIDDNDFEEITTKDDVARFSNLEPGNYKISVKMQNSKDIWSDPVTTSIITIDKPFYSQIWFYISVLFFVGLILFLILDTYSNKKYSKELERKVAERTKELEKSEKKYRQLVETAIDGIISTDRNFSILTWNIAAEKIYGFNENEVLGKNFFEVTKSQLKEENFRKATIDFFTKGTWKGELVQQNKFDQQMHVLIAGSVYKDPNGEIIGMVGVCRDITELKQLEKNKTMAVLESLEKERNRISRDLHDDLGQILSSAKMKLEVFEYKAGLRDDFFNEAIELIGHAGTELRNIVHDLHPAEIERYGLLAAVDLLVFQLQKLSGTNIYMLKKNYSGKLPKKSELMVYRIIQESLNNAIKHSKAEYISVSMEEKNNKLVIAISDKGVGFMPEKLKLNREEIHGYGLLNMFQRADMIGAEIKINSEPGKGTDITLNIRI
ncbi:MAG: hypothetical protein SCALA702_17650 [Melioribacteraceae bacterium]|nr:MAG: hypothetical protein SCALA702_17650 [Melioribacteraceae bacterium]